MPLSSQEPATTRSTGTDQGTDSSGDGDTETTDTDDDSVTLDQVRAALEQYANGDITAEELRDLIRRYLAS